MNRRKFIQTTSIAGAAAASGLSVSCTEQTKGYQNGKSPWPICLNASTIRPSSFEEKINELGYSVPEAPKPLASYIPVIRINNLVLTAGQLPFLKGKIYKEGKLGTDVSDEEGIKSAELCALNCLSVIKSEIGDLNKIERIVKLTVFVNSSDGFTAQPKIANGASDFVVQIFGENGKHARSAVGVNELPLNVPVEIEMIAMVKD